MKDNLRVGRIPILNCVSNVELVSDTQGIEVGSVRATLVGFEDHSAEFDRKMAEHKARWDALSDEIREARRNGTAGNDIPMPRPDVYEWLIEDRAERVLKIRTTLSTPEYAIETWVNEFCPNVMSLPLSYLSIKWNDGRRPLPMDTKIGDSWSCRVSVHRYALTEKQQWMYDLVKSEPGCSQHFYAKKYAAQFGLKMMAGYSMLYRIKSRKAVEIEDTGQETTGAAFGTITKVWPYGYKGRRDASTQETDCDYC